MMATRIVDASCFCGHWPFRALRWREPAALKDHLLEGGVSQAWVSATEAILFPDPMEANEPLFRAIHKDPFYVPIAIINPMLASWREDAESCMKEWGCRALKLVPSYHGYHLEEHVVDDVVEWTMRAGALLCVQVFMVDRRSQHPLMKVDPPSCGEIAKIGKRHPEARLLACGAMKGDLSSLGRAPNVWAEISLVEDAQALKWAVGQMGPKRIVFGSHSPFQYLRAMTAKLDVDPVDVPAETIPAVASANAAALLGPDR